MGNSAVASAPAEAEEKPASTPTPIIDRTQGKIIANRYRLEDTILGTGAFAIVKLGTDLETKKHVAIRIVDKEKLSPVGIAYLRAECEVYKDLDHPSIVKCFLIKEGKKYVIFVTEYMPDGNLSNHFSKKAMVREIEARDIVEQILSALKYLHGRGITWRDLKSSNILLDMEKKVVKICDFGFAARMEPGKLFTDFPGTMAYSPPEVLSATPYEGAPRDIWSLGVFLYKMLTGKYPFGSRTNPNTRQRILEAEPELESLFVSDAAKELLRGMLHKSPVQRFSLQAISQSEWMTTPNLVPKKRSTMAPVIVTKKAPLVRQCSLDSGIGGAASSSTTDPSTGFVLVPRPGTTTTSALVSPRAAASGTSPSHVRVVTSTSDSQRPRNATQPSPLAKQQSPQRPVPSSSSPATTDSPESLLSQPRSRNNTQPLPLLQQPQQMAASPPTPQQPILAQPPQPPQSLIRPTTSGGTLNQSSNSPPTAATSPLLPSSTPLAPTGPSLASELLPTPPVSTTATTASQTPPAAETALLIPDLPTPSFLQPPSSTTSDNSTTNSAPHQSSDLPAPLSQPLI